MRDISSWKLTHLLFLGIVLILYYVSRGGGERVWNDDYFSFFFLMVYITYAEGGVDLKMSKNCLRNIRTLPYVLNENFRCLTTDLCFASMVAPEWHLLLIAHINTRVHTYLYHSCSARSTYIQQQYIYDIGRYRYWVNFETIINSRCPNALMEALFNKQACNGNSLLVSVVIEKYMC